jgi:hypothetical protein
MQTSKRLRRKEFDEWESLVDETRGRMMSEVALGIGFALWCIIVNVVSDAAEAAVTCLRFPRERKPSDRRAAAIRNVKVVCIARARDLLGVGEHQTIDVGDLSVVRSIKPKR